MIDVFDRLKITRQELESFCQHHHIVRLSFFGSVLREDFRPDSDIDVLVNLEHNAGLSLYDFMDIHDKLESMLGRKVDLVEEEGLNNPYRRQEILSTRQVTYEAA